MGKILIVDDEKSIRITLSRFLQDAGHGVETAEDVSQAEALLKEHTFDVVVTDIVLPRISGAELVRRIRAEAPDSLVLMVTGEPTVETAAEAVRAGAYDYLTKPVSKDTILRVVARALQVRGLLEERRRLEAANLEYQHGLERLVRDRTQALRKSEDRYRGLVEAVSDWVWEVDAQGCYTYTSPRVWDLLGYRPQEVIGRTPFDFMAEEEAQRVRVLFKQISAGGQ